MAILLYLKGEKSALLLRETEAEFEKALSEASEARRNGMSPPVHCFNGWHRKPIWIADVLEKMFYASAESDKEIEKNQAEQKQRQTEQEAAMRKAQAGRITAPNAPIMTIPGNRR